MKQVDLTLSIEKHSDFIKKLEEQSGQKVSRCYQCMKCTAGCPFQFDMDCPPNQVMRMLQTGMVEEVLNSYTVHTCAACATCTTRCPRGIDIAKLMDTLRIIAHKRKMVGKGTNMYVFHDTFMKSIEKYGRLYELGLALRLNMGTGKVFQDVDLGLPMFIKGKLSLLPHSIRGIQEVKKLFNYARKMGE